MSTSNWQNISYNIEIVKKLNPKKILDVGIGFGRWGILFREFLEVWGDNNFNCNWTRSIDGIEIFPDYIKEYHKFFYDNIFIQDAFDFLQNTTNYYDLVNCGDVIEHFDKDRATKFIELCLKKGKYVLINIPLGPNWQQGAVNNNEYERHRSTWNISDFDNYHNCIMKRFEDIEKRTFCVVLISNTRIDLNTAYGKYFGIKSFLRNKLKLNWLVKVIEGK